MSYRLYLDDVRPPPSHESDWVWARSVEEACRIVERNGPPGEVSFDYDMGDGCDTGLDFARWLFKKHAKLGQRRKTFRYSVHSTHYFGAAKLLDFLEAQLT